MNVHDLCSYYDHLIKCVQLNCQGGGEECSVDSYITAHFPMNKYSFI